jgi:hypothetical protein
MSEEPSHYITKKNASDIMPVNPNLPENKTYSTNYKEDFSLASTDFWLDNKKQKEYTSGYIMGQFGNKELKQQNFYNRINTIIKETTTMMLSNQKIDTSDLKHIFTCLDHLLKLLSEQVEAKTKENKIPEEDFFVILHGFTNGLIDTLAEKIKQKTEKESR